MYQQTSVRVSSSASRKQRLWGSSAVAAIVDTMLGLCVGIAVTARCGAMLGAFVVGGELGSLVAGACVVAGTVARAVGSGVAGASVAGTVGRSVGKRVGEPVCSRKVGAAVDNCDSGDSVMSGVAAARGAEVLVGGLEVGNGVCEESVEVGAGRLVPNTLVANGAVGDSEGGCVVIVGWGTRETIGWEVGTADEEDGVTAGSRVDEESSVSPAS